MFAIFVDDQQKLVWRETADPTVGAHDVLIRNQASAVNRADLAQRAGHYRPPPGTTDIMGLECTGVIESIGSEVTKWQVGDRVCALLAGGGYAEQVVVDQSNCLPVPQGFSIDEAAAITEVFATAYLNLWMLGGLQPGDNALIHAGASGVGTAAIQLCNYLNVNAFVTVGSQEKLDYCLQLGATDGCLRKQANFADHSKSWTNGQGFNAILDPVGASYLADNIRSLATDGAMITIGIMGGRKAELDMGRLLIKRLRLMGSTLRSRSTQFKAEIIEQMRSNFWPAFDSGEIKPIIHQAFPMQEAEAAQALMAADQNIGKIILRF